MRLFQGNMKKFRTVFRYRNYLFSAPAPGPASAPVIYFHLKDPHHFAGSIIFYMDPDPDPDSDQNLAHFHYLSPPPSH